MKRVYLVRHGETTHNKEGLVQDGSVPLSVLGQKQAIELAKRLQNLQFAHLVVSDYKRAQETAEPVSKLVGIRPTLSELFREVRRPSEFWHRRYDDEAFQSFLQKEHEMFKEDPCWRYKDGENFMDVSKRALAALEYLTTLAGDVVVISHGHFIRHLTAQIILNLELDGPTWQKTTHNLWTTNTGITTVKYDDDSNRWKLVTFNDIAHFAE
jgi:probable phosphoglycerate mutase